jgi:hypothetical protein
MPGAAAEPVCATLEYNRQPAGQVQSPWSTVVRAADDRLRQVLTPQILPACCPACRWNGAQDAGQPMKVTPLREAQNAYDWRYLNPPSTDDFYRV